MDVPINEGNDSTTNFAALTAIQMMALRISPQLNG
jgi:hypothetical protein